MLRLELKEKRKVFWIVMAVFTVLQLTNVLGKPIITRITTQQMVVLTNHVEAFFLPSHVSQVVTRVLASDDTAYFVGQWMIHNFIPVLIFVVLTLGAGSFIRQKEEKSHFFTLNFVSRDEYLHNVMASSSLVIGGWIFLSYLTSVILILALGWNIHLGRLLGFHLLTLLRVLSVYEIMVLISLFFQKRGPVYIIAILIGVALTMTIQVISPFGKFGWLSGSSIFFSPDKVVFELAFLVPQIIVFYLLLRHKWKRMEI